jgi:hypothetical protein
MGRLAFLLVFAGLPACLERVDLEALRFHCESDADCRDGRFCDPDAHVCVATLPDVVVVEPDVGADQGGVEPGAEPVDVAEPEPAHEIVEVVEVDTGCLEGTPCDDGDPCTLDDRCRAGLCAGKVPPLDATCDGRDDDCDGAVDDDYVPQPLTCGVGACAAVGATSCAAGHVFMECHPGPPANEVCNGLDDDCDGLLDAADTDDVAACDGDGDGYCAGVGPSPGVEACPAGLGDCDDGHADAHPGGVESCDAALVDEDCDGTVNEDAREALSEAWPGATEAGWALVAGETGWTTLVTEAEAWLGTPTDSDFYRATVSFPAVSATVVQARVGPFDAGAFRWACLFVSTPNGAPAVACQGLATDAASPDPEAAGCCRVTDAGGTVDVAAAVNLAGAHQATVVVLVTADGGACDAYRIDVATAQ